MAEKKPKKELVKREPRTVKERAYVKEYLRNGGIGYKAAMVAYDTTKINSANSISIENLQKLIMPDLLDRMGLTDEELVKDLIEGLRSTKRISSPGSPDVFDPDYNTRHKWWTSAIQMKGHLSPEATTVNNVTFNVTREP